AAVNENADTDGLVIRISANKSAAFDNQLWLATQLGFFDEEFAEDNITAEFYEFTGGGPANNEAMIAGQLDVIDSIGDQPMITGIVGGTNGIALTTVSRQTTTQGVYVNTDSDIQSVQDLEGKTIGVALGTFTHKCLVGVLEDAGISEDDVNLINLTGYSERTAALENGDVDALVSNYSSLYAELQEGTLRQVADFSSHPAYTFFVVNKDFVAEYPDVTQRLMNVVVRVRDYEKEHPEEVAELIAGLTGLQAESVLKLREQIDLSLDITDQDIEQLQWTYDFLDKHDYLTEKLSDLSVLYDDSYIKNAIARAANE
ncbi:MAG: ABC transporter substrate-binding protein, partial [Candidatus Ornithomonoglobus sp.]